MNRAKLVLNSVPEIAQRTAKMNRIRCLNSSCLLLLLAVFTVSPAAVLGDNYNSHNRDYRARSYCEDLSPQQFIEMDHVRGRLALTGTCNLRIPKYRPCAGASHQNATADCTSWSLSVNVCKQKTFDGRALRCQVRCPFNCYDDGDWQPPIEY